MPETFNEMLNLPDSETSSEKLSSSDILKFVFCVFFADDFFDDWALKVCRFVESKVLGFALWGELIVFLFTETTAYYN
jgi:hypothetical protein